MINITNAILDTVTKSGSKRVNDFIESIDNDYLENSEVTGPHFVNPSSTSESVFCTLRIIAATRPYSVVINSVNTRCMSILLENGMVRNLTLPHDDSTLISEIHSKKKEHINIDLLELLIYNSEMVTDFISLNHKEVVDSRRNNRLRDLSKQLEG